MRPDGVRNVRRGNVAVMLFDHPGIGVAKVLRDDHQWHSVHHCVAGPRVAQAIKIDRRRNLRTLVRLPHRVRLVIREPARSVGFQKDRFDTDTAGCDRLEELNAVLAQDDVPRLA